MTEEDTNAAPEKSNKDGVTTTTTTITPDSSDDNNSCDALLLSHEAAQQHDQGYPPAAIHVDEAIDALGMGLFQYRILITAGIFFASDAMMMLLFSFLSIVLQIEWHLNKQQSAWITSGLFVGALVGTFVLGRMGDVWGRRPAFFVSSCMVSMFGILLGTWANDYDTLLGITFFVGFGVGGLTVPYDICAEFLPDRARGQYLLATNYLWTLGAMFVVVLAYLTLPIHNASNSSESPNNDDDASHNSNNNWRYFVVLSTMPCLFSIIFAYFYIPESPRWLCARGRSKEALLILQNAAKVNGHEPTADKRILFHDGLELTAEVEEHTTICDLFSPKWRWITLRMWGNWLFCAFGYFGTILAVTKIFAKKDSGDATFDYGAIFISSTAELVGTWLSIRVVDHVGRISSGATAFALAGISVFSLCLLAASPQYYWILVSLGFLARVFEMVASCMTWLSTAEILTTEVRSTGHGASFAMSRVGAVIAPLVVQGNASYLTIGIIMLIIHTLNALCVSGLPETKPNYHDDISEHDDDKADDETPALLLLREPLLLDQQHTL